TGRSEPPRSVHARPDMAARSHAAPATRYQAPTRTVTRAPERTVVRPTSANDRRLFEIERQRRIDAQRRWSNGPRFSDAFSDRPVRR
ncbi:MAG: hypothetical protein ACTHLY_09785, partial [Pseudolabrys sp.]